MEHLYLFRFDQRGVGSVPCEDFYKVIGYKPVLNTLKLPKVSAVSPVQLDEKATSARTTTARQHSVPLSVGRQTSALSDKPFTAKRKMAKVML